MKFNDAKMYIDGLSRFGSVLGLESIKALLDVLGNPQEQVKVIHVAGTNGKGSTIAFMASVLKEAGYKVGKYTSPVVFEYLEKYQIDNENISEEKFAKLVAKVKEKLEILNDTKGIWPTIFEVETAMAFEYFKDEGCDIVLLETGMGGDMDATNVCSKVLASVLVSISLDHTGFLGDTIEEIAYHKAGIIKNNCPVVVMKQRDNVLEVIKTYAKSYNAPIYIADETDMAVGLAGRWQSYNAGVAVKVMEVLGENGYNISREHIEAGLLKTKWPGRFEKICDNPLVIIDGAHNPDAASRLRETIDREYANTEFVYIMGVLGDKDYTEVIKTMADRAELIVTVTPLNPRALEADELKEAIAKVNRNVQSAAGIEEAYGVALDRLNGLSESRAILAFGSLSYLGDFRDVVRRMEDVNRQ